MLSVSQLVAHIKTRLESDPGLGDVWLEGEVSNFKQAPSGHLYFTLKDSRAVIPCVMWRFAARQVLRLPVDGEQVLVHGNVSVYEVQGKLQFYADRMEPGGLGRLYLEFEALKARLAADGLFDQARKRPLPERPRRIGVVTSPKAAALRDILRTLAARYPAVDVLLAPTAVQGVDAPAQIVAALEVLNAWGLGVEPIDLLIVARGGGSIEELWAFNDEQVARAIATSATPVFSGVGHETDFTLADFAADARAPTPTGAAALAVPDRRDLAGRVWALNDRLNASVNGRLQAERHHLEQSRRLLARVSPQAQIGSRRQQVDDLSQTMIRLMRHRFDLQGSRLEGLSGRLASLDPRAVLQRGYAIVQRQEEGDLVTSVSQVAAGDRLAITVRDGSFDGVVSE